MCVHETDMEAVLQDKLQGPLDCSRMELKRIPNSVSLCFTENKPSLFNECVLREPQK